MKSIVFTRARISVPLIKKKLLLDTVCIQSPHTMSFFEKFLSLSHTKDSIYMHTCGLLSVCVGGEWGLFSFSNCSKFTKMLFFRYHTYRLPLENTH